MKFYSAAVAVIAVSLGASGCRSTSPEAQFDEAPWLERGKTELMPFKKGLMGALKEGLATGTDEAIAACQLQAPKIAADASSEAVAVGRTSHKLRNPGNAPKDWMVPLLKAYAGNHSVAGPRAVPLGDHKVGYVEPIYLKPMCLTCHGETIAPSVASRLAKSYPADRATGFKDGEFRGMFWMTLPNP